MDTNSCARPRLQGNRVEQSTAYLVCSTIVALSTRGELQSNGEMHSGLQAVPAVYRGSRYDDLQNHLLQNAGWKFLTCARRKDHALYNFGIPKLPPGTYTYPACIKCKIFARQRFLPAVPLRMCWASLGSTRRSVNKAKEADCAEYSVATLRCLIQLPRPAPASRHTAGSDVAFSRSCWHC